LAVKFKFVFDRCELETIWERHVTSRNFSTIASRTVDWPVRLFYRYF